MSNPPKKTITLPKQTQVCLNYWNASTAVDGCEFSTQFQEPLTLNLGDTIGVRNSSLDTSKLSNDLIVIEEELELEFEMVYYAMIRKTEMNFETFNAVPRNHQAWIYAKSSKNYYGTAPPLPMGNDYNPNGLGWVFVNPLWSFMYQARLGTYLSPTAVTALADMPEMNLNFTNQPNFNTPLVARPNDNIPTGFNTGSTLPNNTAQNAPVLLMNSFTQAPFTRKIKITLKKGFYTRAGLAVEITTLMSSLKAPLTSNYPFAEGEPIYLPVQQTQPVYDFMDYYQPTTNQEDLVSGVGNCECNNPTNPENPNYPNNTTLNQINTTTEGINPFQVDILAQHTADTPQVIKVATGGADANDYTPTTPTDQFQRLVWKIDRGYLKGTKQTAQSIPIGESVIGLVNDVNFNERKNVYPVHFQPFTTTFKIAGNNTCPAGVNPQYLGDQLTESGSSLYGDEISITRGYFNTQQPSGFTPYTPPTPTTQTATLTYQVQGDQFIDNPDTYIKRFLPININPSLNNPYTCGTFGTSEISLLYDADKNLFKFADLHTPIMTAPDNKSGANTPSLVRSVGKLCGAYDTANTFKDTAITGQLIGNLLAENQNTEATNDRHSGIMFSSITATNKATGTPSSFWSDIGFNVADITIDLDLLPSTDKFGNQTNKLISEETFNSLTTGELFGISQNINALNTANSINEQVQAPLRYTYQKNYNNLLDMNNQSGTKDFPQPLFPANLEGDIIYASTNSVSLMAGNQPTSVLNTLGGNILLEITGYGGGSELQDKDAFAVKSIVSLYYLNSNTYLSSEGDGYTYTHLSNTPQTISALKVRIINPITKQKLTSLLGNNNSVYLSITQNKEIEIQ